MSATSCFRDSASSATADRARESRPISDGKRKTSRTQGEGKPLGAC